MPLTSVESLQDARGHGLHHQHTKPVKSAKGLAKGYSVMAFNGYRLLAVSTYNLSHNATEKLNKFLVDIREYSIKRVPLAGFIKAAVKPFFYYKVRLSGKETTSPSQFAGALRHRKHCEQVIDLNQFKRQCEERTSEIIDRVIPGSCLLIDFGNGEHTAMLIRTENGKYEYYSYGATRETWNELEQKFAWSNLEKRPGESADTYEVRRRILIDMIEEHDFISDDRCVLLTGLDCEKMSKRARKLFENQNYRRTDFNCSKFAAKVLKSGYQHIHSPFANMSKRQWPENTLRLARELQRINEQPDEKKQPLLLERKIDQCRDIDSVRQLHEANVSYVKSSLRFRLKHFLFSLVRVKTSEEYRMTQLEKYVANHIMGSDEIKDALLNELKNEQGDDKRISELLSLLRLDATSIERVIKMDDPELLAFYLKYFQEDINRRINLRNETMLLCAIRNQSNHIVRALWPQADRSLRDKDGNTPLILAAKKGNTDVVKMQYSENPDITETNKYGKTALDMARKYNHFAAARFLEQKGDTVLRNAL